MLRLADENPSAASSEKDSVAVLTSRISNLREILKNLRCALQDERKNLRQEIDNTIRHVVFVRSKIHRPPVQDLSSYSKFHDYQAIRNYFGYHLQPPSLIHSQYEELWDDGRYLKLHRDLDSVESNCVFRTTPSSVSDFYKQKILNLEADCSAGLSQVKAKFVESLQALDDYTMLGENCDECVLHPEQIIATPDKDLNCIFAPSITAISKSKSLQLIEDVQSLWSVEIGVAGGFCDEGGEPCGLIYQASTLRLASSQSFDIPNCLSDVAFDDIYSREFSTDTSVTKAAPRLKTLA